MPATQFPYRTPADSSSSSSLGLTDVVPLLSRTRSISDPSPGPGSIGEGRGAAPCYHNCAQSLSTAFFVAMFAGDKRLQVFENLEALNHSQRTFDPRACH